MKNVRNLSVEKYNNKMKNTLERGNTREISRKIWQIILGYQSK